MTYEIIKTIHLGMIFLLLLILGGAGVHMMAGGTKDYRPRKLLAMFSGVALVIILVTGYMLAKQIYPTEAFHGWIYGKILVWLYLGGIITLVHRKPKAAGTLLVSIFLAASLGAFLAIFKPW